MKKNIFLQKKTGAFICAEATQKKDFFENARFIVKNFFFILNIKYQRELFVPGIDKKGGIMEHPEYLEKAYQLGRELGLFLVKKEQGNTRFTNKE